MLDALRNEMKAYYETLPMELFALHHPEEIRSTEIVRIRTEIYEQMDAYYAQHPDTPCVLLKSRLYEQIAERFEPVVFLNSPFWFEMGIRERDTWGAGGTLVPGHWFRDHLCAHIFETHPLAKKLQDDFTPLFLFASDLNICSIPAPFDIDHHTLGYTELFAVGVTGLLKKLADRLQTAQPGSSEEAFCLAAQTSCRVLLQVSEKFADRAEQLLQGCTDEKQAANLRRISQTARRIPAQPPVTFYEGLAMLLFTREAVASLDHIGISQLGHMDRLLGPLYEADLAAGRITETEARELLGAWMLHTDIKFDLEHESWPETSTCIQLGGCDENGRAVFNAVTRMVIEEHHRLRLVNPKLNCRYSPRSDSEYLKTIGRALLGGHNNFVLINDDVVIPGLMRSGVAEEDARLYVSGGCQETMIEGCGHTEGAALYVSVPRLLDLFLNPDERISGHILPALQIDNADSFDAFYAQFMAALKYFFSLMTEQRNARQFFEKEWEQCPLFSATQKNCIENGQDYVCGGAKYNFSTIALVGLGTTVDSLYALWELVYRRKAVTLPQLKTILSNDWAGQEPLRRTAVSLPKYGHGLDEPDALANRFLTELAGHIAGLKNERGGNYIPSLFVYHYFSYFSDAVRATPDGRKAGSLLSPGCSPSQLQKNNDITAMLRTMHAMDFTVCGGGSAVLDIKLPASNTFTVEHFAAFARTCGQMECPTLQPNVVSQQELLDAREHPERHKDLIVRVSGLSAYFVALEDHVQKEIIARDANSI